MSVAVRAPCELHRDVFRAIMASYEELIQLATEAAGQPLARRAAARTSNEKWKPQFLPSKSWIGPKSPSIRMSLTKRFKFKTLERLRQHKVDVILIRNTRQQHNKVNNMAFFHVICLTVNIQRNNCNYIKGLA
ncbi:hypothetical protein ASF91_13520 [Rhizobium sp. Leaf155]|nr:hypothetical protein ASF91_13520 [Rhizobium sp. Leaf155]